MIRFCSLAEVDLHVNIKCKQTQMLIWFCENCPRIRLIATNDIDDFITNWGILRGERTKDKVVYAAKLNSTSVDHFKNAAILNRIVISHLNTPTM